MTNTERLHSSRLPPGYFPAPIHPVDEATPLAICVLVRADAHSSEIPFIILRELPGARVHLGVICDAESGIQEWVEIWTQIPPAGDLVFSGYQTQMSNLFFDSEWQAESDLLKRNLPGTFIATRMESQKNGPVIIKQPPSPGTRSFTKTEITGWRLCTDDALLESHGLASYTGSPFRYLHEPLVKESKTFLATTSDAPTNPHVQGLDRLKSSPEVFAVFNPHAGPVRVTRHDPLSLEDYLQILEGQSWNDAAYHVTSPTYAALQEWSANPKGLPFLLHGDGALSDRLNEILFLKLSALLDAFKEIRARVKIGQLPMLNLSPVAFRINLQETGGQFPALWSARCRLAKPGQAYPLKIKSTEQKYFIRLGKIEPSPFLPEGMGAHSFGIGNVQVRTVTTETGGVVLEGTLVAEDYLSLDPNDLLWFKLPLGEEKLDFYAHVYKTDAVGPREARFRTVPAMLPEATVAALKHTAGTRFPKSPYEIWPLLSSPCDLYSLGVMSVRILLANSQSNLPVILDEILSLARRIGEKEENHLEQLKSLLGKDERLLDLTSPVNLVKGDHSSKQACAAISTDIWLAAVSWLLRLFPGTGIHGFCKDFGDVSPLALETVFDQPMQQLETILLRLRSILAPSLSENTEISKVILQQLKNI